MFTMICKFITTPINYMAFSAFLAPFTQVAPHPYSGYIGACAAAFAAVAMVFTHPSSVQPPAA